VYVTDGKLATARRGDIKFKYYVLFINFEMMRTAETNTTIVEGYVGLLDNLSTNNKLDLIAKLTASVKSDLTDKKTSFKKTSFKKAFGAFDSKKTAEEIIVEIRNSRISTRQIESF
jgi:hypothetical protein